MWRLNIKGNIGQGVSWIGRLDIYSHIENPIDQFCNIRLMEVTRNRKITKMEKDENGNEKEILDLIEGEKQKYLVLEPSEEESELKLYWIRADYKTTLKGLGRQYHAQIDLTTAVWAKEFYSSCRSGRYGSKMALVIVSPDHPAYYKQTGDIQNETRLA